MLNSAIASHNRLWVSRGIVWDELSNEGFNCNIIRSGDWPLRGGSCWPVVLAALDQDDWNGVFWYDRTPRTGPKSPLDCCSLFNDRFLDDVWLTNELLGCVKFTDDILTDDTELAGSALLWSRLDGLVQLVCVLVQCWYVCRGSSGLDSISSTLLALWTTNSVRLDWTEQCFTTPPTQYRLCGRRFLQGKRPNQQYQSTEGRNNTQREIREWSDS